MKNSKKEQQEAFENKVECLAGDYIFDLVMKAVDIEEEIPNKRLRALRQYADLVHAIANKLNKEATKIYDSLDKDEKYIRCPHCNSFLIRENLVNIANGHEMVEGEERRFVDLGPYDGYETRKKRAFFMWAECPCCGEKIYTQVDRMLFDQDNVNWKPLTLLKNYCGG